MNILERAKDAGYNAQDIMMDQFRQFVEGIEVERKEQLNTVEFMAAFDAFYDGLRDMF